MPGFKCLILTVKNFQFNHPSLLYAGLGKYSLKLLNGETHKLRATRGPFVATVQSESTITLLSFHSELPSGR